MKPYSSVGVRYAESLAEIYEHVHDISIECGEEDESPLIWFRGHSDSTFNLNPSIFRGVDYQYNENMTYSNNHLREDYRFQSFMARNYDNVDYRMPQYIIEWQEIMQHFFTKTRLMDWSESLTVSLEFALEAFITPNPDLEVEERRRTAEPVIWLLQPAALNKEVYDSFVKDELLVKKALAGQNAEAGMEIRISDELRKEEKSGIYYNLKSGNEKNLNAMISLSALEILRDAYKGREMEALKEFEMNPFFYLLLRYYSDGVPVEMGKIPPLAIIHPYHS